MARLPTITPGMALFPLRLFLGGTFVYAGIQKLSDPGFLDPDAPSYIGTQLEGFSDGAPGLLLLEPALSHAAAAGVGVALLEIMIGAVVLMGVLTRPAAAIGLALNLGCSSRPPGTPPRTSSARTSSSCSRGFRSSSPAPRDSRPFERSSRVANSVCGGWARPDASSAGAPCWRKHWGWPVW